MVAQTSPSDKTKNEFIVNLTQQTRTSVPPKTFVPPKTSVPPNDTDTTAEEQQINKMVYKLYNLTYEEVKIIQPNFTEIMSKKNVGSKFWISLEIKKSEN